MNFVCAIFYACFWHRFWEASGRNFEDLGVISGSILSTFSQMLQNSKNETLLSEMLGLGGVGLPFGQCFCLLFGCVFHVAF